jgi:N-acetylmuramoyl-L-alanine amidase
MFSFMQNVYMEQSLTFAAHVEAEFVGHARRKSRGVKQGPFLVLWKTTMPSVLIEIGFISNAEEERYLNSERGQNEIAEAILNALSRYKAQWEKSQLNTTSGAPPLAANSRPSSSSSNNNKPSTTSKPAAGNAKNSPTIEPNRGQQKNRATYHIQIFSTSKLFKANAPEFKGLKNISYYKVGDSYRYYVGSAASAKDAMPLLKEIKKKFYDAFIVKLRNGRPERQ